MSSVCNYAVKSRKDKGKIWACPNFLLLVYLFYKKVTTTQLSRRCLRSSRVPTFRRTKLFIWSDASCITATPRFMLDVDGTFYAFVLLTLRWSAAGRLGELVFSTEAKGSRHSALWVTARRRRCKHSCDSELLEGRERRKHFSNFPFCRITTLTPHRQNRSRVGANLMNVGYWLVGYCFIRVQVVTFNLIF